MKHLLIVALFIPATIFSQEQSTNSTEIQPYLGYGISNVTNGKELFNFKNTPINAFVIGANINKYLSNRWSISGGVEYKSLGCDSAIEYDFYNNASYYKFRLQTVNVPVMAHFYLGSSRKWNIMAGPAATFIAGMKKINGYELDGLNRVQIGAQYGFGYQIFENDSFKLGIGYQGYIALSNNYMDRNGYKFNRASNMSKIFQLNASFKLN